MLKKLFLVSSLAILSCFTLFAGVAGTWDLSATTSTGEVIELVLTLQETDGSVSGTLGTYEGNVPIDNGKVEGNKLTFQLTTPEGITYSVDLELSGDQMKGTYSGGDGSSGTLSAKRSQ